MFIVIVSFKQPIEIIQQHLEEHRLFLDECYAKNYFITSGQNIHNTGGIIISQLQDKNHLQEILNQDPLSIHNLAKYEIIEFTPTKHHPGFAEYIS